MPRTRKTIAPVPQYPTGLPYGQATTLAEQAAALPTPPRRAAAAAPAPSLDDRAAAAMAQLPDIGLGRPTERPGEPVTAGLELGPGRGPMGPLVGPTPKDPSIDMLSSLATATGDADMAALAAEIGALRRVR